MRNEGNRRWALWAGIAIGLMGSVNGRASLIISAGSASVTAGGSGSINITLQNTSSTAFGTAIDGFSVVLSLSAADSSVTFTGANMSTTATYIFNGDSLDATFSIPFFNSSPPTISDIALNPPGIVIPGLTTLGLGVITFMVAPGASSGMAPITLTTDGTTDISDDNGATIASTLSNGEITITGTSVPEPSTLGPLALLLVAVGARARRYKMHG